MTDTDTRRWKLRLSNYVVAVDGLEEVGAIEAERALTELEKAGAIRRFEITWELGWKLMADVLRDALMPPEEYTPMRTIRAAMGAGLIADGDDWIAAGKLRNTLAHGYDVGARDRGLLEIATRYLPMFVRFRDVIHARAD